MRVDLDAIEAGIKSRRQQRQAMGIGLWCSATESRLLGAMLAEPGVLERCNDVDADDFWIINHRLIFGALRNVQSLGRHTPITGSNWTVADCDAIMRDLTRCGYHAVTWLEIGDLMASTANYGPHDTVQFTRDVAWLRTLATRRKAT